MYITLPNFCFNNLLVKTISELQIQNLSTANRYGRFEYIKSLRTYHKLSWLQILTWANTYGWFFSTAGVLDSYRLPTNIENDIVKELLTMFDKSTVDDCVIRLQVVYGGDVIPLHIDITRTASIIYPIHHNETAYTVFCQRPQPILPTEQLFKPSECNEVDRVLIDHISVLFDTKVIHGVYYHGQQLTKNNPRVSVSIKWKTLTIDNILNSYRM